MTLEALVENSIITDFQREPVLASQLIRNHDYPKSKTGDDLLDAQEARSVITVTAYDRGDFFWGSGIRNVAVQVEIRVNGSADGFAGSLLDQLSEKARDRLQTSTTLSILQGREQSFSNSFVKVFGVTCQETTPRTEAGFERIRIVVATFIAAQLV